MGGRRRVSGKGCWESLVWCRRPGFGESLLIRPRISGVDKACLSCLRSLLPPFLPPWLSSPPLLLSGCLSSCPFPSSPHRRHQHAAQPPPCPLALFQAYGLVVGFTLFRLESVNLGAGGGKEKGQGGSRSASWAQVGRVRQDPYHTSRSSGRSCT